jgi:tRNA A37 threonylcarbamoyladenosine dehydratase
MNRPSKSREAAADMKQVRADRLAAALRENLRRRKAQARAKQGGAKEADKDQAPSR